MKLNDVVLDERTEKALKLCAEYKTLGEKIKGFVGEANCGYDDDIGIRECRKIASTGIISATQSSLETAE